MDHKIIIKKAKNFVHIQIHGPATLEVLEEQMTRAAEKAKQWGFDRYCADFRKAERQVRVIDDYDIAYKKARKCGLMPGTKHALIVRKEDIEIFRFIETVFYNNGYNLKVFTVEDAAILWIIE